MTPAVNLAHDKFTDKTARSDSLMWVSRGEAAAGLARPVDLLETLRVGAPPPLSSLSLAILIYGFD